MSRITLIDHNNANAEQKALRDAIKSQLGMLPNFLKVFANSPVALKAFLGLHGVANEGTLSALTRERIALALAQQNACEYCLSAHTAIGRKTGLTSSEMSANRLGSSEDAKAAVAVKLARSLSEHRGEITTAELIEARNAGYTDAPVRRVCRGHGRVARTDRVTGGSRHPFTFPTRILP